jgi:hypothetical protein
VKVNDINEVARCGVCGANADRTETAAGQCAARDRRRASGGPRRQAAKLPALRWCLPREGLPGPCGRDVVRSGHDEAAPISQCQVWWDRDWYQLAITLSIDPGTGPAPGSPLGPDDLPGCHRPAGADVSDRPETDPETLRRHTLRVGEGVADCAAIRPETSPPAMTVTLDSTFIRSCEDGERHLEVRVGNVETKSGARQVFDAVAKTDTNTKALIRRNLDAIGRSEGAELTVFTDGCPGLRRVLADAGVAETPILDWFHIGMRLEHLKQIAGALTTGNLARVASKAVIVTEVERLRWRIWNGKAKNARKSIIRIRAVMHHFRGEPGNQKSGAPSRKLWTALHALDGYLTGQSAWLVNYAERHRAGLRVGTAITEGTANFLVNRRMNKPQQMRWSRRGADLLLQVRCAVYNVTLGFDFGQKFDPANDVSLPTAVSA